MRTWQHIAILLLVSSFLYFFALGGMPLTDPDETFYAETAKEMAGSGEWITPTIFGKPQFEKPILYYWLVEISYKLFGVTEFSSRLPSAVFGVIGVIGVYLLGRVLFSPLCGLLSALAMSTSALYIVLARACVTDIVLTVFILFCMLLFILGWQSGKKIWYMVAAAMAAFAVLTKGPIGLLIPGAALAAYVAAGRRWRQLGRIPLFWSILVFLAVSLPWYVMVTRIHGGDFLSHFFGFQNVTRFLVPEHRLGSTPLFYIPIVLGGIFPWTPFLVFGAWHLYKKGTEGARLAGSRLFLAAWFLTVFVFFTVARTKLVTYIFPLFPVLAVVSGRFWEAYIRDGRNRRSDVMMNLSFGLLLLVSLAGQVAAFFVIKARYGDIAWPVLSVLSFFTAAVVVSYLFVIKGKGYKSFFTLVLAVMVLVLPFGARIAPAIATIESSKPLAEILGSVAGAEEAVAGECDHRRGIAFYSGRTDIEDVHPYHDLGLFVSRKDRVWAIIQDKHFAQLKINKSDLPLEVVAVSGEYVLITNKPYKRR